MTFKNYQNLQFTGLLKLIISDARAALTSLSPFQRAIHIFWLCGPFILLIERSPADLWLSVLALGFVVRSFLTKNWEWLSCFWVKASFIFWAWCIFAGAVSSLPAYSVTEAFIWIRFPLFAMATVFWLAKDKRLVHAMLFSTFLGLLIMCGILTAEILIEGQKGGRLMWPYGDLVPGNYVAKVGLPVFVIMVSLAVSANGRIAAVSGFIALFTMMISIMTGERINFIIRAFSGMLAALLWRPKWRRYLALVAIEALAVILLFQASPDVGNRFVNKFIEQLPIHSQSVYYKTMMPGVMAFEQSPITGIGTGNFRLMCDKITQNATNLECHPHPHNYYIQLAAETGIIGLVLGIIFMFSIIWACLKPSLKSRENIIIATAWVIPFAIFWPITSSADFFGQWHNIFIWSAIALALVSSRYDAE